MIRVSGVRFKSAGKVYYFDPGELNPAAGENVVVETARGVEYGTVAYDVKEVNDDDIISPLKPILRIANESDRIKHEENQRKKNRALALCQDKVDKHGLDMKLVDVEYTFDNSKVIFYFTADGRVDFRELVKDLAGVFKMRIELRQIGVRDETKMMGGIGSCGRDLCCHCWLPDFEPVSVKMAKVQNLSLNPVKISGICGRLMCCLQYENDVYMEMRKGMPENGEVITTRDGKCRVFEINILENKIKTRLILEEKTDEKPEKLSTEYYFYGKEEILKRERQRSCSAQGGSAAESGKESREGKEGREGRGKGKGKGRRQSQRLEDADLSNMSEEEFLKQAEALED